MEQFIKNYNINNNIYNYLNFGDDKGIYIYFDELENKKGNRYNYIIEHDIKDYSYHSPSCFKLYNLLSSLNITTKDKIIDIGSGRGFALCIFKLFNFSKISGIETSLNDINICKNNLNILNIKDVDILNINALNFNNHKDYNFFYFYNPFDNIIFEKFISNINHDATIIYKNIHELDMRVLKQYNFILFKIFKGEGRDYYIYKNY